MDRLASAGVLFARATCQVPLTLPSHCSILTGTYPPYHGVRKNGGYALDRSFDTLAEILRDHGYRTGAFLSSFSLNHIYGIDQGFDEYDDVEATRELLREDPASRTRTIRYPERSAAETIDQALAWLGAAPNRPTFLWVHLFDPHDPYEPEGAYRALFADDPYRGEIAAMDRQIERLIDAATDRGPAVFALVADHGEGLGDHGERTHGFLLYEECLRVPLVVAGEGCGPPGSIRADLAETVDLLPTLLALAGVRWSAPLPGRNLLAAAPPADSLAYAETLYGRLAYEWSDLRAIRDGDWKYIAGPSPALFDLAGDPGESRNVMGEERSRAETLAARLGPILANKPDLPESAGVVSIGREEAEALAALGYVGPAKVRGAARGLDEVIGVGTDPEVGLPWIDAYERLGERLKDGHADSAVALAMAIASSEDAARAIKVGALGTLIMWERYAAAKEVGQEIVRRDPAAADAHVDLAVAHLALGERPAARAAIERALASDPKSHLAYFNLGRLFVQEGKSDSAMGALRESLRLEPKQVPTLVFFTRILLDVGRAEEAYRAVREAVRLEPGNKAARELRYTIEQEFPELVKAGEAPDPK